MITESTMPPDEHREFRGLPPTKKETPELAIARPGTLHF